MTEEQSKAFETIMSKIENVEELDNEFGVIRNGLDGVDSYEAKYNDLRSKYIARFKEETAPEVPAPVIPPAQKDEPQETKIYDASELDWDASTE